MRRETPVHHPGHHPAAIHTLHHLPPSPSLAAKSLLHRPSLRRLFVSSSLARSTHDCQLESHAWPPRPGPHSWALHFRLRLLRRCLQRLPCRHTIATCAHRPRHDDTACSSDISTRRMCTRRDVASAGAAAGAAVCARVAARFARQVPTFSRLRDVQLEGRRRRGPAPSAAPLSAAATRETDWQQQAVRDHHRDQDRQRDQDRDRRLRLIDCNHCS